MAGVNKRAKIALTEKSCLDYENYAKLAEALVGRSKQDKSWFQRLSTSKLRGIYGLIMNVYTRITDEASFEANKSDLQYIKVKMAYESGRDETVKNFVRETYLMACLDRVSTYDQFILYCRYAESLVAYFKFYGGKE